MNGFGVMSCKLERLLSGPLTVSLLFSMAAQCLTEETFDFCCGKFSYTGAKSVYSGCDGITPTRSGGSTKEIHRLFVIFNSV